jgi:phosphocarrier protein FPr
MVVPSVGLVVVSHSRDLARAAVELASQMLHDCPVRIAVAAGMDDGGLGTDAVKIKEAIEEVDSAQGVVVVMDLGSAVLSAELALDLIDDPDVRDRVILSAAPIVEGLVMAVVAAAGGAAREEVAVEAQNALMGKVAHLSASVNSTSKDTALKDTALKDTASDPLVRFISGEFPVAAQGTSAVISAQDSDSEFVAVFTVQNKHGLHARPAARLVSEVRMLNATVRLRNLTTGQGPVPGASLSRVATLAALRGHDVEILASGQDAKEAIKQLVLLAARHFDEPLDEETFSNRPDFDPVQSVGPLASSPGIGIGPVRRLRAASISVNEGPIGDPSEEWRRVLAAVAEVRRDIERLRAIADREAGTQQAKIFDAHLMLLSDTEILEDARRRSKSGAGAEEAWTDAMAEVEKQWAELPDPYLSARAEDVRAVASQVLTVLTGASGVTMSGPGVLVAQELTPAQAAELDRALVRAIVLAEGSPSSHTAILARSRGIPAVVAAGAKVLDLAEGTILVVDGTSGEIIVDPSAETLATFRDRAAELARQAETHHAAAGEPALTADGTRIEVAANLGSAADARAAATAGADSAGLVRTEFVFVARNQAPDVDEQVTVYLAIADALGGRRIVLRTLDVGGDKPLSYLPMPVEANPFLGRRGLRVSLARRDLLHEQLVAVCRVARGSPISVMFPMVTTVAELIDARGALEEAAGPAGLPPGLQIGIMVEVPAAALKIEAFLPYLDFISIGTNDLTQYTLAAERGNAAVAALSDPLDPGVLRLIQQVCDAASGQMPVAVCGEAAADDAAIPVLLGLGVRELSVAPHFVPSVKARVRSLDISQCGSLARAALRLGEAGEVRQLASSWFAHADADSDLASTKTESA